MPSSLLLSLFKCSSRWAIGNDVFLFSHEFVRSMGCTKSHHGVTTRQKGVKLYGGMYSIVNNIFLFIAQATTGCECFSKIKLFSILCYIISCSCAGSWINKNRSKHFHEGWKWYRDECECVSVNWCERTSLYTHFFSWNSIFSRRYHGKTWEALQFFPNIFHSKCIKYLSLVRGNVFQDFN